MLLKKEIAKNLKYSAIFLSLLSSDITEIIQIYFADSIDYQSIDKALLGVSIASLSLCIFLMVIDIVYGFCCGRNNNDAPSQCFLGFFYLISLAIVILNLTSMGLSAHRKKNPKILSSILG